MSDVDEYVCPRCGNPAEGSSFCPSCGLHLDAVELPRRSAFQGPRADVTEESLPSSGLVATERFSALRLVALLVILAIGGFGLARPEEDCGAFSDIGDAAPAIAAGAFAALIWIAIVATLIYAYRRARKRRVRWSLLDRTTLIVAGLLIVLGSAGVASQRANDCGLAGATVDVGRFAAR